MKKLLLFISLAIMILSACGNEDKEVNSANPTVKEYKSRVSLALSEMGDSTNLKVLSEEVQEDGKTVLTLSENIMIFLETNENIVKKATLGMTSDAYFIEKEDFNNALLLFVGTVDDSLSLGNRNTLLQDLKLKDDKTFSEDTTNVISKNEITYTYNGSVKENFLLQAEY